MSVLLFLLGLIIYINKNDDNYNKKLIKGIINHTDISNIEYVNKYDNHYIVTNNKYIYLLDDKYQELLRRDIYLIHENDNNYEIIYKDDNLMYFNDYMKNDVLVYEYYDINTYKLINRVLVGGNIDE